MNNTMKKTLILLVIFVISLLTYMILANNKKQEETITIYKEIEASTIPTISIEMFGANRNLLVGYVQDFENKLVRDSLTILPEDSILPITINTTDDQIKSISYEVRTLDASRLIERTTIENYERLDGQIKAVLPIADLLETETQYMLQIDLETETREEIHYYTRIMKTEIPYVETMISLALDFSKKTLDYDMAKELIPYLEYDPTKDSNNLGSINLESSFDQLTWGRLDMVPVGEVQLTLKELDGLMSNIELKYLLQGTDDSGNEQYYEVEENFTFKWSEIRIYLMNYRRNVNEIFYGEQDAFVGKRILLGIHDLEEIAVEESQDEMYQAFVSGKELWSFHQDEMKAVLVYSAGYNGDVTNQMGSSPNKQGIKILNVNDTGDIDFLVYGHMSHGSHEGQMGIAYYEYLANEEALVEGFFIPSVRLFDELEEDIATLSFLNDERMLYLHLDQGIYGIGLESKEYIVIADLLDFGSYAISQDMSRIAWQGGGDLYHADTIHLLDLNTGIGTDITAQGDDRLRTLGFVGNDLIYGHASEDDLWITNGKVKELPMYAIEIINEQMEVETRYERSGSFLTEVVVEGSRIHLNKVNKIDNHNFVFFEEDTIVCNVEIEDVENSDLGYYASEEKGRVYYVPLNDTIEDASRLKVRKPKNISYDNTQVFDLKSTKESIETYFYGYGGGEMLLRSTNFSDVLFAVYDKMGIIVDEDQNVIWDRVNRGIEASIPDVDLVVEQSDGKIESYLQGNLLEGGLVIDASGISLQQVLYFIEIGMPILSYQLDGTKLWIIGYDNFNITVYEPVTGSSWKMGQNDATAYFEAQGNDFMCVKIE